MKLIIDIPDHLYKLLKDLPSNSNEGTVKNVLMKAVENGTPLPQIIDSLKELSKDHRHNYSSNSHVERAWRLGIEDSIDLILAESEEGHE